MRLLLRVVCLIALIGSVGCGCGGRVFVCNQTDSFLSVQIAMPYPAYAPLGGWCGFETRVGAGEEWDSARATSDERFEPTIRPNSVMVMRVALAIAESREFAIESGPSERVCVTIAGASPGFGVRAIDGVGREIRVWEAAGEERFFR
ncbi:MAG: hypothetical protein R3B46_05725 [Phycisphaerales bacterium]|nr:hypothetical protein [Phycisphaerales bacterium]